MVAGSETTGSGTRDGGATGMPSTVGRNTEYRPLSTVRCVLYSLYSTRVLPVHLSLDTWTEDVEGI